MSMVQLVHAIKETDVILEFEQYVYFYAVIYEDSDILSEYMWIPHYVVQIDNI